MIRQKKIRSVAIDENGYVFVLVALMLPVFLGLAALSLDVANMESETTRAQSAADSAALTAAAAAQSTQSESMDDKIEAGQTEGYAVAKSLGYSNSAAVPPITVTRTGSGSNESETVSAQCNAIPGSGDVICVGTPPAYGRYRNQSGYWEAIIRRKPPLFFGAMTSGVGSLFGAKWWANGHAVVGGTSPCIVVLDPRGSGPGDGALTASGTSVMRADCGIYVNSASPSGITTQGTGDLCATLVSVVGSYTTIGNAGGINSSNCVTNGGTFYGSIITNGEPIPDPYISRDNATQMNAPSSISSRDCGSIYGGSGSGTFFKISGGKLSLNNSSAILPADCVYNNELVISNKAYLDGSVYYFADKITLNGGAELGGYGTINLTTANASISATSSYKFNVNRPSEPVSISGGASSPSGYIRPAFSGTTGWNRDFVIFQSAYIGGSYSPTTPYNANTVLNANFSSGGVFNSSGAFYLPRGNVQFQAGGGYLSGCALFVVFRLNLGGGADIGNACGVSNLIAGIGKAKLVENGY